MDILDVDGHVTQALLKKYRRQINTARIIIFILIAFAFLGTTQSEYRSGREVIGICIFSMFLIINILGYKWPFASLAIFTFFFGLAFIVTISGSLKLIIARTDESSMPGMVVSIIMALIQVGYMYYMIRCTIDARKYEQLKKQMKTA